MGRLVGAGWPAALRVAAAAGSATARPASEADGTVSSGWAPRDGVLPQHPFVQGAQRQRRLEPEGLVQDVPGAGVDLEGVGLPAAAVQRDHQQPGQGLQGRVVGDDRLQVGDDLAVPAEREGDLGAFGQRGEPQLGQPCRLGDRPLLGGEVAERLAAPERQGVVVRLEVLRGCRRRPRGALGGGGRAARRRSSKSSASTADGSTLAR